MRLILEQRYLFNGSVAAVGHHATHADPHDPAHAHDPVHAAPAEAEAAIPSTGGPRSGLDQPIQDRGSRDQPDRPGQAETVLFVDPRTAGWQTLVAGVRPGIDVIVLDPTKDGITQVTQALVGLDDVRKLEFLTYGAPGLITLGGTTLDTAVMGARATEIAGWSAHLTTQADIVFWGCDVGRGSAGAGFVADMHTLTGATIGASSDPTGSASSGADWNLEVTTGALHRDVIPFTAATLASYGNILDNPGLTGADASTVQTSLVELDGTSAQRVSGGETVTYQLTLTDGSATAMAYDLRTTLALSDGLNYIAGSLKVVSGGTATITDAAVGTGHSAITGIDLAPGTSEVLTFQAKVDYNLREGTPLSVTAAPSWDAAPISTGVVAAFAGVQASVTNDAAPLDPSIMVVGTTDPISKATTYFDPTAATPGTALTVSPGEITRMRLTDQVSSGTNPVLLTVTLPTGMTYQGGATVLLASPNGNFTTSLPVDANLQLAEGDTSADIAKLDLGVGADTTDRVIATLAAGNVSISGQTVTFNLGSLSVTNATEVPNYVFVEFNAAVGLTVADKTGLSATLAGIGSTTTKTATQTVDTGYLSTELNTTLNLPEFDPSLGTLNSMTLTLTGNILTSGTITSNASTSNKFTATLTSDLTLDQSPGGPAVPGGPLTIDPSASSSVTLAPGESGAFAPLLGSSPASPATATTGAQVFTTAAYDLTGFEAAGGGTVPLQVTTLTGVLVLGGGGRSSSVEATQAEAIAAVFYDYTPFGAPAGTVFLTVEAPSSTADTAPVLANPPAGPLAVLAGASVLPFATATVADSELDTNFAHDFSGTTLTLQRYVGGVATPDAADVFSGTGAGASGLVLSGGQVNWAGSTVGSYTDSGGKLTISFAAAGVTATIADDVLQHIGYSYGGSGNPLVPGIVLGVQIDDANSNGVGGTPDLTGPHDQGTGGDLLSNVLLATMNVHGPAQAATFIEPNDASPSTAPYPVAVAANADLSDIALTGTNPSSIALTMTNAHAEDVLAFTSTAKITGSYVGGTLTLTSGVAPSVAEWQAALRSVTYYDTSDVPVTTTRNMTIAVTAGGNTAAETETIAINPVNDSPILNTGIAVSLNDATEYQGTGTPTSSGATGILVSQLAGLIGTGPGNVTDPDGAGLTAGASAGATGIAITGFATKDAGGVSIGSWYFSTDNGTHWTAFSNTISDTQPLDLAATARVAFQPTVTNFNGQVPAALTFRAWDGFDGTLSGNQATTVTGATLFGQAAAPNDPAGAYSIATDVLPLMVDNVNNAPTASGSVTLQGVLEGTTVPQGATVSALFDPGYADTADQQFLTTANPLGSLANPMAGIAITGNAATPSQGVWEYSVDNGSHWTAISTSVSSASSVVLPNSARVAFLPAANFAGTPGQLSAHLIDSSAAVISGGLSGASLAADTTTAFTGIDVSANGGATAISTAAVPLNTTVYAPTLSVVGESNATAGHGILFDPTGQTVPNAVLTTDGEIVRMRATLELPEGSNTATTMTVTLPTGLSYAGTGAAVLLVSPDGDFDTSLAGVGQLAEHATAADTSKLGLGVGGTDAVTTALSAGAISTSGQTVTFNLGTLTNDDGSPLPNYVIVEFNAVVGGTVAGSPSALGTAMFGSASGATTPSVNDFITVEAPIITLQKVVQGITYNPDGSATVTYVDTVTNSGNGPGYNLSLTDPGAGPGTPSYTGSTSGGGIGAVGSTNGTSFDAALARLDAGTAQSFIYTVTIPASLVAAAVAESDTPATATWNALNPALETAGQETLSGTSLIPQVYSTTASAGLDLVSGTVNQDTAPISGTENPLVPLSGQTVSVGFPGQSGTETIQTAPDGSYTVLVPDNAGPISLTVTAAGGNAPSGDVLDNHPDNAGSLSGTTPDITGANPAILSFTPASNTNYTGITFDFWHPQDTAPLLSNGPSAELSVRTGAVVEPFAAATVSDLQLDPNFTHDYSSTTMTLQRYVGGVAAPNPLDVFNGTGSGSSGVVLNAGQVLLNGGTVGSYTESGGKLTILFASTGVTAAVVNNVLQHIGYSYAGTPNPLVPGFVLGVQIDDANNDPIGLNGVSPNPAGAHDQGPGGNLVSNVLTATVNALAAFTPPAPGPTLASAGPPRLPHPASDLVQTPTDLGLWTTNDFLARPIIPDLSLVGSVANRFIIVEQHAIIAVPPNIFQDTLEDAQLTYDAKLPDGSPLPNWLTFDGRSLTFTGTPPASAYGRVTVLIRATDIAGNTADATFNVLIGRRHEDLGALFRRGRAGPLSLPAAMRVGDAGPGLRDAAVALEPRDATSSDRLGDRLGAHLAVEAGAPAPIWDGPLPSSVPGGGFSDALRNAGSMGALARARALLDSLDALTANRTAA